VNGTFTVHVGNSKKCRANANNVGMPKGGASITLRLYRPKSISDAKAFENRLSSDNSGK
jgi:hypothetical protein